MKKTVGGDGDGDQGWLMLRKQGSGPSGASEARVGANGRYWRQQEGRLVRSVPADAGIGAGGRTWMQWEVRSGRRWLQKQRVGSAAVGGGKVRVMVKSNTILGRREDERNQSITIHNNEWLHIQRGKVISTPVVSISYSHQ